MLTVWMCERFGVQMHSLKTKFQLSKSWSFLVVNVGLCSVYAMVLNKGIYIYICYGNANRLCQKYNG